MSDSKVKLPHKPEDKPKPNTASKKDSSNNFSKPNIKPNTSSNRHDTNLAVITVGVAGLAWYMFR